MDHDRTPYVFFAVLLAQFGLLVYVAADAFLPRMWTFGDIVMESPFQAVLLSHAVCAAISATLAYLDAGHYKSLLARRR